LKPLVASWYTGTENRLEHYFAAHIVPAWLLIMSKILFRPVFNNVVTG
jgi:hypothetical protein